MTLPFSQACENNKQPILTILQDALADSLYVFEIGAGTGQHAVHFAPALPHLTWQAADLPAHLPDIQRRFAALPRENLPPPLAFDMAAPQWPQGIDAVFSANTAHIMPWPLTAAMISQAGATLPSGGLLLLYGPFNYQGQFTSASNARFNAWLTSEDPARGLRDFEAVDALAQAAGMSLEQDHTMPENNRLLQWRKV